MAWKASLPYRWYACGQRADARSFGLRSAETTLESWRHGDLLDNYESGPLDSKFCDARSIGREARDLTSDVIVVLIAAKLVVSHAEST